MQFNIFYSWQSDLDDLANRSLIEGALKLAINNYSSSGSEFDIEWNIDRDTQGVLGTVDIVDTIFQKIDNCSIFIGDISIINSKSYGRKTPNPNVLVELGYAASHIGWKNIICLYNKAYGQIEDLPFDLRLRRPLCYELPVDASKAERKQVKGKLAKAIGSILDDLNTDHFKARLKVNIEYAGELKPALNLVLRKPNRWVEQLLLEVFSVKLNPLIIKLNELEQGLAFRRISSIDDEAFHNWIEESLFSFTSMIDVLTRIVNGELQRTLQLEDKFELAVSLKRIVDRIAFILSEAVEWQYELSSLKPSNELASAKALMANWAQTLVRPFEQFVMNLTDLLIKDSVKQIQNKQKLTIELLPLPNGDELLEITQSWVNSQINGGG